MSENELVAVDNSTAPSTIQPLQTVDVGAAEDFMNNYQELVKALLDESDYQDVHSKDGVKKSKKKSAWRKLATAFNISDDVIEKEIIHDECHRIISARYEVKATLPNGRHGVGTGSASIFDKINKRDTKEPTPFELRQRFTNAEHDITSTAHTRAKSRAISDLIGAGEVSAEELEGVNGNSKSVKPKPKKPKNPNKNSEKKPKTTKTSSKPKKDEAIEVEAKPVEKSFKEICDENKALSLAVEELQANEKTVNHASVTDKLLDLWDMDKVTKAEYDEAKKLLE